MSHDPSQTTLEARAWREQSTRWQSVADDWKSRALAAEDKLARIEELLYEHPHCIGECACATNAIRDLLDGPA